MSRARILIVEDEPNIVVSLRFILERAGFTVEIVSNGALALRRLKHETFAALLLDVMLPGMNGFDVLREIRRGSTTRDLPVIVLTAKGQASDRETAREIGATAFITKPFSNAEVVECVRALAGV